MEPQLAPIELPQLLGANDGNYADAIDQTASRLDLDRQVGRWISDEVEFVFPTHVD
jgi:hypothetical protein